MYGDFTTFAKHNLIWWLGFTAGAHATQRILHSHYRTQRIDERARGVEAFQGTITPIRQGGELSAGAKFLNSPASTSIPILIRLDVSHRPFHLFEALLHVRLISLYAFQELVRHRSGNVDNSR
jgi:hypothetical protein